MCIRDSYTAYATLPIDRHMHVHLRIRITYCCSCCFCCEHSLSVCTTAVSLQVRCSLVLAVDLTCWFSVVLGQLARIDRSYCHRPYYRSNRHPVQPAATSSKPQSDYIPLEASDIRKVCVSACTQKTQTTPDEHPRRHHLAYGQLSPLYLPSPSFSSFGGYGL